MKTFIPSANTAVKWYLVDAQNKTLGKLAVDIANILRGKNKPDFTPHMDNGGYVVVINAEKIKLSGKKLDDKKYYRHSGYMGGLKETTARELLEKKPTDLILNAVKGMLPKNKLRAVFLKKLRIFSGEEHTHTAQKPEPISI